MVGINTPSVKKRLLLLQRRHTKSSPPTGARSSSCPLPPCRIRSSIPRTRSPREPPNALSPSWPRRRAPAKSKPASPRPSRWIKPPPSTSASSRTPLKTSQLSRHRARPPELSLTPPSAMKPSSTISSLQTSLSSRSVETVSANAFWQQPRTSSPAATAAFASSTQTHLPSPPSPSSRPLLNSQDQAIASSLAHHTMAATTSSASSVPTPNPSLRSTGAPPLSLQKPSKPQKRRISKSSFFPSGMTSTMLQPSTSLPQNSSTTHRHSLRPSPATLRSTPAVLSVNSIQTEAPADDHRDQSGDDPSSQRIRPRPSQTLEHRSPMAD